MTLNNILLIWFAIIAIIDLIYFAHLNSKYSESIFGLFNKNGFFNEKQREFRRKAMSFHLKLIFIFFVVSAIILISWPK